uniref:Uncharacterized protein n=1 Tax=Knipowitschia caucasica TaxID=637954 RepID=A0AAV2LS70_KNICA
MTGGASAHARLHSEAEGKRNTRKKVLKTKEWTEASGQGSPRIPRVCSGKTLEDRGRTTLQQYNSATTEEPGDKQDVATVDLWLRC